MRTIVVVRVPDAAGAAAKAVVRIDVDYVQSPVTSGSRLIQGQLDSPQRDSSPPPFWTWFIENPRAERQLAI